MYMAMNRGLLLAGALSALTSVASVPAGAAESAYISQVSGKTGTGTPTAMSQPTQIVPTGDFAQRQTAFSPTPETTRAAAPSTNLARTLQIGNYNNVTQLQASGSNYSNVNTVGNDNNVSVLQGGKDYSNVAVINTQGTQGLSVAVIQPAGVAPVNMLIAKLPNGSILIKR